MSEDVQDVTTQAPADEVATDPVTEAVDAVDEPTSEAVEEPVAEAVAEPVGEAEESEAPPVEEPVVEAAAESAAFGPVRVARVFVCERGHRTTTLWGEPEICQARPFRNQPECGFKLYHITELPEQVQKALNPLKASKKASKKK